MTTISIVIPVVRPEKAKRCIEAVMAEGLDITACGGPPSMLLHGHEIEVLAEEDADRIGCPRMVANLAEKAKGDLICFLGDDTIPQPGWLGAALRDMESLPDGWGLVGLADGTGRELPTHWLAHRKLQEHLEGGEFFHTGYQHCFSDNELWDIARGLGRYVMAHDAKVDHDHPLLRGQATDDEHLKRVYAPEVYAADRALYLRRKAARNGFKLGIGYPLIGHQVPVQFWLSLDAMARPDHTRYTPTWPVGEFPHDIAAARNSLLGQALDEGCTHLLMLDTDQVYPPDLVERLLAHDKDIVGARVHRRYPPFDPIMMRGEIGKYSHVPDEEAMGGGLVEVDATGTGCLLIKLAGVAGIPAPWFQLGVSADGKPYGEDIYFCSQARQRGLRIFVDTGLEVGHLAQMEVRRGTYEVHKKITGFAWKPPE